ncbi:MAG: MFS transporter [Acidimicrobiaceae bacterium]|nr:MFS transporter [Acidimicrobiaceae bacterium]
MPNDDSTAASSGSSAAGATRIGPRLWALPVIIFMTAAMTVGQITILGKQVFDMTGKPLDLGLLGLAEFVPTLLLAPLSGVLSDRFDRRVMYACGLAGEAAASAGLYFYVASGPTSVVPIFALVMAFGCARSVLSAASRVMPVDMAPPGAVERMVAVCMSGWQAGFVVGPVVFSFVFVADVAAPYLLATATALAAAALLAVVPASGVARSTAVVGSGVRAVLIHALQGLRFIRRNRVVLGIISLDLFAVLFGGAVALLPAIAEERLGVGAVGLGWLRAAVGIGALATMAVLAVRPLTRRVGLMLMAAVGVFGLGTIVLGLTRSYAVAFIALLALSGADSVSVFVRSTLVPLATPEDMRGRVMAVEYTFVGASNELGAFESGVAGALLGVAGAVVFGGVGTLVVVAAWWMLFPELRRIDHFAEVRPDT